MTLNASGTISLGGSTTGQSVELELGESGTAAITMNDSNFRGLAGVASGTISLSSLYSKSASGSVTFTSGSGSWTVPAGVTSINVVCVAPGGPGATDAGSGLTILDGGGGGGLAYITGLAVTPGQVFNYSIGTSAAPNSGGSTSGSTTFKLSTASYNYIIAYGGQGGDGNGDGGIGGVASYVNSSAAQYSSAAGSSTTYSNVTFSGGLTATLVGLNTGGAGAGGGGSVYAGGFPGAGGGAAGWSGAGGAGGADYYYSGTYHYVSTAAGAGGGGGGGLGGSGGSVGVAGGQGANGAGIPQYSGGDGGPGSGGSTATGRTGGNAGTAGAYGAGGLGYSYSTWYVPDYGGPGVVRIMWGPGRAFPATNAGSP